MKRDEKRFQARQVQEGIEESEKLLRSKELEDDYLLEWGSRVVQVLTMLAPMQPEFRNHPSPDDYFDYFHF